MILAGDIGGTKSWLRALDSENQAILADKIYPSADFSSLEAVIEQFKQDFGLVSFQAACLGVPGPVAGRQAKLTNLPWLVDADNLEQSCNILRVEILNDFTAAAYGIDSLNPAEIITLQAGEFNPAGNRIVVGAGTGLGVAPVFNAQNLTGKTDFIPQGSEGGHIDFAPTNPVQQKFLNHLWQKWDNAHVSYERVLCGDGLEEIYAFLLQEAGNQTDNNQTSHNQVWLRAEEVTKAANGGDAIADAALKMFTQIYGAYIGNISVLWPAFAGVYIAGGIAAKILPWMQHQDLIAAIHAKGGMRHLVEKMPVYLVTNPALGLLGASAIAQKAINNQLQQSEALNE